MNLGGVGETTKPFRFGLGSVLLGLIFFSFCIPALGNDPTDPTSPNYQGAGKLKSKIKKAKRWRGSFTTLGFRSFDEFGETGAYYEGNFAYKLGKKWSTDVTVAYSHPFDLDAERSDRWEWEDVRFRLVNPSVWKSSNGRSNVALRMNYSAPVSGTSQDASSFGSVSVSAPFTYSKGRMLYILTPVLLGAYHEFETADVFGFTPNSPFGVALTGAVRVTLTKSLSLLGSSFIYTFFDYEGRNRNLTEVAASLQFKLSRKVVGSVGWRRRDRIVTNNSFFDDDALRTSASLTYIF